MPARVYRALRDNERLRAAVLPAVAAAPLLLLVVYSAGIIILNSQDLMTVTGVQSNLHFSQSLFKLAKMLQIERGTGYMYLKQASETKLLRSQYINSSHESERILNKTQELLVKIHQDDLAQKLRRHRSAVVEHRVSPADHLRFYTNITHSIAHAIVNMRTLTTAGEMWTKISCYDLMLICLDLTGLQQALGGGYFAHGGFDAPSYRHFAAVTGSIQSYMEIFQNQFGPVAGYLNQAIFKNTSATILLKSFTKLRDSLLRFPSKSATPNMAIAKNWTSNAQTYISLINNVQDRLLVDITGHIGEKLLRYRSRLVYTVTTAVFLISILLYYTVLALKYAARSRKRENLLSAKNQQLRFERTKGDLLLYLAMPKVFKRLMSPVLPVSPTVYQRVTVAVYKVVCVSDTDPSELYSVLSLLQRRVASIIDGQDLLPIHASTLQAMLVAGVPVDNGKDHLAGILRCADHLHKIVEQEVWHGLRLKFGIAAGSVMGGIVESNPPSFCLIGNPVERAEYLAYKAEPGKTLMDDSIAKHTRMLRKTSMVASDTNMSEISSLLGMVTADNENDTFL